MKPVGIVFIFVAQLVAAQNWHSFQGYEYHIVYAPSVSSYVEAKVGCCGRDSSVANVKTKEVQNFLVGIIKTFTDQPYSIFIGATRNPTTNEFQWTDGTSVNETQWYGGEPNNNGGTDNCVTMGWFGEHVPSLKWFDVPCSYNARYICERKLAATVKTTNLTFQPTTGMSNTATTSTHDFATDQQIQGCESTTAAVIGFLGGYFTCAATVLGFFIRRKLKRTNTETKDKETDIGKSSYLSQTHDRIGSKEEVKNTENHDDYENFVTHKSSMYANLK